MATNAEAQAFINMVAPVIVKYAKQYGFKVASPIIAQACLESGYGKSALAKGYNYFGMKAGSSWTGAVQRMQTQEQKPDGNYITIYSNFRGYSSLDQGIEGYFKFITGYSRYSKAPSQTTPRAYLQAIKDAGYATSIKYVDNVMNTLNKWNMAEWDKQLIDAPEDGIAIPTIRLGSAGPNVLCLNKNLNEVMGFNIPEVTIFDQLSEAALIIFQHTHDLVPDGIYGKKSAAKVREILSTK